MGNLHKKSAVHLKLGLLFSTDVQTDGHLELLSSFATENKLERLTLEKVSRIYNRTICYTYCTFVQCIDH